MNRETLLEIISDWAYMKSAFNWIVDLFAKLWIREKANVAERKQNRDDDDWVV